MDIARQTDCKIAAAKQSSNGSILGLSNEIVCILAAQRAVKLPRQRVCLDSKSVCIVLTKILASILTTETANFGIDKENSILNKLSILLSIQLMFCRAGK